MDALRRVAKDAGASADEPAARISRWATAAAGALRFWARNHLMSVTRLKGQCAEDCRSHPRENGDAEVAGRVLAHRRKCGFEVDYRSAAERHRLGRIGFAGRIRSSLVRPAATPHIQR